jgi:DNA-binding FrmR family transcriptional regulator
MHPKGPTMAHTVEDKQKLINRVRRLRGQLDALERALEAEESCEELMQLLTASRGAVDGLMVEVVEGYVRTHLVAPKPSRGEIQAAEVLLEVLRAYIR